MTTKQGGAQKQPKISKGHELILEALEQGFNGLKESIEKCCSGKKSATADAVALSTTVDSETVKKLDELNNNVAALDKKVDVLKSNVNTMTNASPVPPKQETTIIKQGIPWWIAGLLLILLFFCCMGKDFLNVFKEKESASAPCNLDTRMWVPGVGTINDPEALAALKGTDTIYLSFPKADGERFKKVLTLANAYDAGKQIEYLIDFQKIDSVQNFCTFLVQDFRITDKPLVQVQDTVKTISLPSVIQKKAVTPRVTQPDSSSSTSASNAPVSDTKLAKLQDPTILKENIVRVKATKEVLLANDVKQVIVRPGIENGATLEVLVLSKLDSLMLMPSK